MINSSPNNRAIESVRPTCGFYIFWVMANGTGTAIGVAIYFFLAISLGFFRLSLPEQQTNLEIALGIVLGDFKASIPFGSIIGVMQWFVLRKHITNSGFWIVTSAIAMFIGITSSDVLPLFFKLPQMPNLFLLWFLFGGVSGVLQWIILRKQINYSGLWIPVNIIAGSLAGVFGPELGIIGGSIGWAMTGIFTGGILFILLQKTKRVLNAQNVA
jgi:hypothetical protein